MKQLLPQALNFLLFTVTLLLSLQVTFEPPLWLTYSDAYDYLHQSRMSLLDLEFYFPRMQQGFCPRPFTVPLFYKLAASDETAIVHMQQLVHALSALFVGFAMLRALNALRAKITFLLLWYLLMGWWNILGWTHVLLSESLSLSLLFCWLATFVLYWKSRSKPWLFVHMLIAILFSFTRDSWPYMLLLFYLLAAILAFKSEQNLRRGMLVLLAASCIVFFIQQRSAVAGGRYRLPVMNNIVLRVLANEAHLKWFAERGMPMAEELQSKYGGLDDPKKVYALYTDTTFRAFSNWAAKEGRWAYTKFLLSHPSRLLLWNEEAAGLRRILACNIGYTGPVSGYSQAIEPLFPAFHFLVVLLLNIVLLFFYREEKRRLLLLPSLLIITFAFNAVLLYVADAMEVERHLFITNIMVQFTGILLVCFMLDYPGRFRDFFAHRAPGRQTNDAQY